MKRILVVRNDKIGDFMLAWPAFATLKLSMPQARLVALVPSYTQELAKICPWIDEIILDPGKNATKSEQRALGKELKEARLDASICLFSNTRNALLMRRGAINDRWAPATKLAQFLYNHRVTQRRSRSEKPEYLYNQELVAEFLNYYAVTVVNAHPPYLSFPAQSQAAFRDDFAKALSLDSQRSWALVHSGSGGSANNLSLAQYAQLVAELSGYHPELEWLLTAGPGEEKQALKLRELLQRQGVQVALYHSQQGLVPFCQLIACGALFIAGSTGPLHIAGALDVPTIGFYPSRRSALPLRWQPLNSKGRHIAFAPPRTTELEQEMSALDMNTVAKDAMPRVVEWLSGSTDRHI